MHNAYMLLHTAHAGIAKRRWGATHSMWENTLLICTGEHCFGSIALKT